MYGNAVSRAGRRALDIESLAKRRLADEYDAAQERGEVRANGERTFSAPEKVGPSDIGLTPKDVHEARIIRDAEAADPAVTRRTRCSRACRTSLSETDKAAVSAPGGVSPVRGTGRERRAKGQVGSGEGRGSLAGACRTAARVAGVADRSAWPKSSGKPGVFLRVLPWGFERHMR